MIKAVVSPVNLNYIGNSLSSRSYTTDSDMDDRLKNNTEIIDEKNGEDTQVSESDNDLDSSKNLSASIVIPESDSDDSFPDYSHLNAMFDDSQNMCYIEKVSKYTGLVSREYIDKESVDFSQCDNGQNLNAVSSETECLNGENIAGESKNNKPMKYSEILFNSRSCTNEKMVFQGRNKQRKRIATEALNNTVITTECDVENFPKKDKWKITCSSSNKYKVNKSEAKTFLKGIHENPCENKDKRKVHNFNKSQKVKTVPCSIEKLSIEVNKHHDKKLHTTSRSSLDRKKSKLTLHKKKYNSSTIKKYFPKISSPENTALDTSINTKSPVEILSNNPALETSINVGSPVEILRNNSALDTSINIGSPVEILSNNPALDTSINTGSPVEILSNNPVLDTSTNTGAPVEILSNKACISQMPDFLLQPFNKKCRSSYLESSSNVSVKRKKHLKLRKTLRDKSENNRVSPSKEIKSRKQRLSRKVKEKSHLNISEAGSSSENIQSYFSRVSTKQNISSNCSINENIKSQVSSENKTNNNNFEKFEHFTKDCIQTPESSRESLSQKCINSSENLSIKTKKHLKLGKTLRDKSENNLDKNPHKEAKYSRQRLSKKVKAKSHLNTSKLGSPSGNIHSYFSSNSVSIKQSTSGECTSKENIKCQISSKKIKTPKLSVYNKINSKEIEQFTNSPDYPKKEIPVKKQKLIKDRSLNKSKKSQNKSNDATNSEESSMVMKEREKYRVAHLSLDELENEYIKHENYLIEIFTGKESSWRHDQFCKGGPSSRNLRFAVSTIPFTDKQLNHLLILFRQTFCRHRSFVPYFDYFMKVLLPEVTTRIFMDMFCLSQQEVLDKLHEIYISSKEPIVFGT